MPCRRLHGCLLQESAAECAPLIARFDRAFEVLMCCSAHGAHHGPSRFGGPTPIPRPCNLADLLTFRRTWPAYGDQPALRFLFRWLADRPAN